MCDSRLILLAKQGITTTCRDYSAMRDVQPKQKVYWEMIPSAGPSTMFRLHHTMDDTALRCRSIPQVEMEHIHGWSSSRSVDRYVTEISAGCNQSVYPENVALQDASSSAEQSVADMVLQPDQKKKHHLREVRRQIVSSEITSAASHG